MWNGTLDYLEITIEASTFLFIFSGILQIAKLAKSLIFWKIFPEFLRLEPTHWTRNKQKRQKKRKNHKTTEGRNQKFPNHAIASFRIRVPSILFLQFLKLKMN